ncbi:MAG: hypothetical protein ABJQ14_09630 [Hyphomicrobiales bacterium]
MNARKERNTQCRPNRSNARPIPCVRRVNAAEATFDFTQEDKLDDPSFGDAMRPDGEEAAAEETAVVFGASG